MGWERNGEARGAEPAPARRHRHQLHGPGRGSESAAGRAVLHHPGHRHAPAARRRPEARRHHRASAQPPCLRPSMRPGYRGLRILQPRVSVATSSAAEFCFARIFAGQTTADPYTTAVSDTYQDRFGEGTFTGKGLYDVDAFAAALAGRVPDNALLSHDLFEGVHARAALVTDVEVVDDYPSSVLTHARRQHRWARGDWQILAWLFPFAPTRSGLRRNRLPIMSRWKILDNLRRSQLAPATLTLLLFGWTVLPGSPALWTAIVVAATAFPLYPLAFQAAAGPRAQQPWRTFLRGIREDAGSGIARVVLPITFMASQAYEMTHALVVTLFRLVFTQRRLLEWETAAASAARGAGGGQGNRLASVPGRDGGQPGHRALWPAAGLGRATGSPAGRGAGARPLGRRTLHRLRPEPSPRPERDWSGGPGIPPRRGAQDLGLLRGVHGPRRPRPSGGQLPGGTRAEGGPPDLADQHRHGAALHARGPRPRLHPDPRARRAGRCRAHDDGRAGAPRGAPLQLVRHREPGAARSPVRVDGRQRKPRRERSSPSPRGSARWRARHRRPAPPPMPPTSSRAWRRAPRPSPTR